MRAIEFFGEPLSYGGQEAFILNVYRYLSKKIDYTFVTPFYANNKALIQLIRNKKDQLIVWDYPFDFKVRKLFICKAALNTISSDFDIIHIHSGSVFTLCVVAAIAKKKGVKKIIVHSHATGKTNLSYNLIKCYSDHRLAYDADWFLACSKMAGEFKFSRQVLESDRFRVIKNGIDLERFVFNPIFREKKREELGLQDKHILISVGRLSSEKNQLFLLDVFAACVRSDPTFHLLIVGGEGNKKAAVLQKIKDDGLSGKATVLINRSDVNELLWAADAFVFPSLFEGLGISAIEAQAAGLPTYCSENVPEDAAVSRLFYRLNLADGPEKWARFIIEHLPQRRDDVAGEIKSKGYDVKDCASVLETIYLKG